MKNTMYGEWWVLLIRGVLALLIGVIIFARPQLTLTILLYGFATYAVLDGIFQVYLSIIYRPDSRRWWLGLLSGLISIALGIAALIWTNAVGLLILLYLAIRAIVDGLANIITGIRIGRSVRGEWLLITAGIIATVFGAWMLFNPILGGMILLQIVGGYSIVMGCILIVRAFLTSRGKSNNAL